MAKLSAAVVSIALLALVIALVFLGDGTDSLIEAAGQLSLASLGLVFAALLANALFATLRFHVIARDLGHRIGFWQALAAHWNEDGLALAASTTLGAMQSANRSR